MIKSNLTKIFVLFLGLIISVLPDVLNLNETLSIDAKLVVRMSIFMIYLWLTEIVPISITALIPILFSPFFMEIKPSEIVKHYASPVVFLLLGGFILAQGFEKSQLHKRIALKTMLIFGNTREKILLSIIFSTAFFIIYIKFTKEFRRKN